MSSGQERAQFLGDPHWPYEQINRSVKKCRFVAFDPVTQKQQHPATHKARRAGFPAQQCQQGDSRENQGDADAVEQLVPS
jgi:hypothetical protein